MSPAATIAFVLASYALGCVCSGYYLVRAARGVDVRETGSGSAGGTNAARVLGRWALPSVFVLDALKGVVVAISATVLGVSPVVAGAGMVAVVAGHIWPAQLGLRGGRGVSTSIGALVVLDPPILAILIAVAVAVLLITRNLVLSGVVAYAAIPVGAALLGREAEIVMVMGLMSLAVVGAHLRRTVLIVRKGV